MEHTFLEAQYPALSREKEIAQMLAFVKEGKSSQILSVPGGGRSTLLGLLAYNASVRTYHLKETAETYHFVMVSFSEIRGKASEEAIKLIFLDIVASLEDRPLENTYESAKALMKESFSYHDELVLLQGLKKIMDILTLEHNLTVVLLFDQFETFVPTITKDFFQTLRILQNRAKYKLSIVFSLDKPLEYLLEPTLFTDFAEFVQGHTIYLSLCDPISLSFRIESLEKTVGKTLEKTMKDDILHLTAGHSRLTRQAVHLILSAQDPLPKPSPAFFLSEKPIASTLADMWQSLNPAEQTHFLKNLFPHVLADEHSQYLEAIGLMTQNSITMPLFAAFVEEKQKEHQEAQSINYAALSDKLTATEFRLLQFFLQHPTDILERDMIIQGVWKENKSVAGVTDQALDQLIFRLRRKIEDDPNHPAHLVTVKGRGFKFLP